MKVQKLLIYNNISELMRDLQQPSPLHPLVALLNYDDVKINLAEVGNNYEMHFYKISFKTSFRGQVKYGHGHYDFEEGGLAFVGPEQVVTMSGEKESYEGYSLFFHPDLISHHPLSTGIHKYGFFSYSVSEALYLSGKEKKIIASLFEAIGREIDNNIDQFSQDVLVSQIELLLNYSNRYYNRQFITRKNAYHDLISQMDIYLWDRFNTQRSLLTGLPTVQELADYLKVTPRYLTDLLKSLTGQSAQQHIHNRLIEKAKNILSGSKLSIAEVAYELGFEHPQSFNKLFRQKLQMSPLEFRHLSNNPSLEP